MWSNFSHTVLMVTINKDVFTEISLSLVLIQL